VYRSKAEVQNSQAGSISILLLCALALDLPILISYNYQLRFFLPMLPILAVKAREVLVVCRLK
jgi:hypothetical protein